VKDERHIGKQVRLGFHGQLTPVQKRAAEVLLQHDIGVFVAPPGLGKTVLATHLLAERGRNTLILVHRSPLLDQWVTQLSIRYLSRGGIDCARPLVSAARHPSVTPEGSS